MSKHTEQQPPRTWRSRDQIQGIEGNLIAAAKRSHENVEISYPMAKALIEICQQARWVERMREKHPMSQALRDAQDAYLSLLVTEGR